MGRTAWRAGVSVHRRIHRRERISFIGLLAAGALGILGEAAARFGWLVLPTGLPFPPEALAQGLFAIVPMDLFSLAIGWLGSAAQWIAFAVMLVLWALVVGALSNLVAAVAAGGGPLVILLAGALVGCIVQGAWWLAAPVLAPGGWVAVGPAALWPGVLLPAGAYGVAALVARAFRRPRY
ncbi:MAG TPA: hypothetical protein VIK93_01325 [Limnochordales bacterium]